MDEVKIELDVLYQRTKNLDYKQNIRTNSQSYEIRIILYHDNFTTKYYRQARAD